MPEVVSPLSLADITNQAVFYVDKLVKSCEEMFLFIGTQSAEHIYYLKREISEL
ncbi:hypothetical protein ES703_69871 [subsurface metagenome]